VGLARETVDSSMASTSYQFDRDVGIEQEFTQNRAGSRMSVGAASQSPYRADQ
jgi:hypothetical protein